MSLFDSQGCQNVPSLEFLSGQGNSTLILVPQQFFYSFLLLIYKTGSPLFSSHFNRFIIWDVHFHFIIYPGLWIFVPNIWALILVGCFDGSNYIDLLPLKPTLDLWTWFLRLVFQSLYFYLNHIKLCFEHFNLFVKKDSQH